MAILFVIAQYAAQQICIVTITTKKLTENIMFNSNILLLLTIVLRILARHFLVDIK